MNRLRDFGVVGAPALLALAGFLLWGGPADPDVFFEPRKLLGAFLIFLFWAHAMLCWGEIWLRAFRLHALGWLGRGAAGIAFAAVTAEILGQLGLIGYSSFPGFVALCAAGPLGLAYLQSKEPPAPATAAPVADPSGDRILSFAGYALVATGWALLLLKACIMHGTSDPVLYHLVGPRLWADWGVIHYSPDHPFAYNCWYWEDLFIWGQVLMGGAGGRGLIENQLFGQWVHVFFGMGLSLLGIRRMAQWMGVREPWVPLAMVASILSGGELLAASFLAKNDWGVIGWALTGLVALFALEGRGTRYLWAAVVFMSFALASKLNALFGLTPFVAFWLFQRAREKGMRSLVYPLACYAVIPPIVFLPILVRNWVGTGNPLFPFAVQLFKSSVLGNYMTYYLDNTKGFFVSSLDFWLLRIQQTAQDSYLRYTFYAVLPLALLLRPARRYLPYWLCTFAGSLWFYVCRFPMTLFFRWISTPLLFMGAIPVAMISSLLERAPARVRQAVVLAGLFATVQVECYIVRAKDVLNPPHNAVIRMNSVHIGGGAKTWLRLNASPTDRIFSTGDNQLYYISNLRVAVALVSPEFDVFSDATPASVIVDKLWSRGIRYIFETTHWNGGLWSYVAQNLVEVIDPHPESIVFEGPGSRVIDLRILKGGLEQACMLSVAEIPGLRFEEPRREESDVLASGSPKNAEGPTRIPGGALEK